MHFVCSSGSQPSLNLSKNLAQSRYHARGGPNWFCSLQQRHGAGCWDRQGNHRSTLTSKSLPKTQVGFLLSPAYLRSFNQRLNLGTTAYRTHVHLLRHEIFAQVHLALPQLVRTDQVLIAKCSKVEVKVARAKPEDSTFCLNLPAQLSV